MKVNQEYDVAEGGSLEPTGNYNIYTDDGEWIDSTDASHLRAVLNYILANNNKEDNGWN